SMGFIFLRGKICIKTEIYVYIYFVLNMSKILTRKFFKKEDFTNTQSVNLTLLQSVNLTLLTNAIYWTRWFSIRYVEFDIVVMNQVFISVLVTTIGDLMEKLPHLNNEFPGFRDVFLICCRDIILLEEWIFFDT
ncbi:hypothetical protein ACJX0J_024915, partial [Zea mays]